MEYLLLIAATVIGFIGGAVTTGYSMAKGFSEGVDRAIKEHKEK